MGIETDIEWCDSSVNPTENCDGCELWNPKADVRKCYAGKLVERWKGRGAFDKPIVLKPGRMAQTLKWSDLTGQDRPEKPWLNGMPRVVFVGDMADLLSKAVPFEYIEQEVINTAYNSPHLYLMLTKQARRMEEFVAWYLSEPLLHGWPHNLWMGVSVTSQATAPRMDALFNIREMLKLQVNRMPKFFVSYGPALAPVWFEKRFDWMVIEGESGRGDVAMLETSTVRETVAWCRANGVKPFVKQMGTAWAQKNGSFSFEGGFKGGDVSQWPDEIRVREMPNA
jgi:protein gp37